MKTLILGPLDYPSIRQDLVLINAYQNVYSIYYAFEGVYASFARKGEKMDNQVAVMLLMADEMTQEEYDSSDIFFGLAPKRFQFDRIIEYNYDTLMAQEALISDHYKPFEDKFYTTLDITHSCKNIMEAIKLAQSSTKESD